MEPNCRSNPPTADRHTYASSAGGYEDARVREVVEAREAANVLSDVFLDVVRGTRGIRGRDN